MPYLLAASLVWALSFGLIARELGAVDPDLVAAVRLLLATLAFSPFLGRGRAGVPIAQLMGIGALQFGLMYVLYIRAYAHLQGHQIAILTCLTPLYVVLLEAGARRRLRPRLVMGALLAVAGGVWISAGDGFGRPVLLGVALVQGANLCFAAGQLLYRRIADRSSTPAAHFAWLYLGAFLVTLPALGEGSALAGLGSLSATQLGTLAYLGLCPTALAFLLWNVGATRTRVGPLAVANNLKVPLAVVAALLIFGEQAAIAQLITGSCLIGGGMLLTIRSLPGAPRPPESTP